MNLSEFKAWFEGFTESLSGPPNAKQWKRICEKVALIKDAPATTYPVFVDRWVRPYWYPYWQPYYSTCGFQGLTTGNNIAAGGAGTQFNSLLAFQDLGRAKALNVTGANA